MIDLSILIFRIIFMTFLFVMVAYSLLAFFFGGPFVPTMSRELSAALFLAEPKKGELWMDLGSGDGRLLEAAAKLGLRGVGYEINPVLVLISRLRLKIAGLSHLTETRMGNFWLKDISEADILSVYLIAYRMEKLQRKLAAELRPGARVISFYFELPDWKPAGFSNNVYLYVVPERSK